MKTKAHIRYRLKDNTIVPGVTTITGILAKPALKFWANKIGLQGIEIRKYVDDKADIGTLAHAMVTDYLKGDKTNTDDYTKNQIGQAENAALSFFEWEKKYKIEPILIEKPLISEKYGFGGTADIYAKVDGVLELVDLKTGKGIFDEMRYQVSAYKELLIENGYPVDRVRILNIPRTENESFVDEIVRNCNIGFKIILSCLSIYNLKKEMKRG
ncbi:hypothetical protein LCGC14_0398870 [marine sediment metagenome]|uniref:PD-(D/E)XK endonuclease-like domain-containing protein n=1 Tax=marine sediment metagenome TaxID=412755 RepID=A0A0F9VJ65_9ZZZZ|nr:hypothetical protein [Candidatus Aminicenantes bacterium]